MKLNTEIIRGPDELKDLPTIFGEKPLKYDLSKFETSIFAEITDALNLTVEEVIEKAEFYRSEGADVIDIIAYRIKNFTIYQKLFRNLNLETFM